MNGIGQVGFLRQVFSPYQGIVISMSVRGTDVSFYQDNNDTPQKINFVQMKAAGAKFVFIRGGQNLWKDPDFDDYWRDAKAAGLKRGIYYLMDSRVSPVNQAEILWSLIKDDMPEMEIVVDYEESYGGAYGGWRNLRIFLETLMSHGIPASKILIYTGYYYWREHCPPAGPDLDWFKRFGLWIAWYTTNPVNVSIPAPWTNDDLIFWQYTDKGNGALYGVESGNIDLDWFRGDDAEFNSRYGNVLPPELSEHTVTHDGVDFYHLHRFGTDCFVHVVDLSKVYLKIVDGFRSIPDAMIKYSSNLAFNGGGWGLQPGNVSAPNEYLIIEGVVKQDVAVDGRPAIEVTKDNRIVFHTTQPNFNTSWNVWGFDRMIAQNGVYNTRITDPNSEPRTVYGRDVDGKLVILVCEGRAANQKGLTFPEVWSVMKEFNAIDCGNADGGYSSAAMNDYFDPPLLNPTYQVEYRRTQHQILLFANGGSTPPPDGGNVYRYSATSIVTRALRDSHNAYGSRIADIPAGIKAEGDALFVANANVYDGSGNLLNMAGDKWLHVLSIDGVAKNGWTAIIHKGVQQMTLIDNGPVTPPPTTTKKIVRAIIEYDDQSTEELFP